MRKRKREIDGPLDVIRREADGMMARGFVVFQRWTCAKCGSRQTIPEAGNFYIRGECEECHHVTPLDRCGFMAVQGVGGSVEETKRLIERALAGGGESHE